MSKHIRKISMKLFSINDPDGRSSKKSKPRDEFITNSVSSPSGPELSSKKPVYNGTVPIREARIVVQPSETASSVYTCDFPDWESTYSTPRRAPSSLGSRSKVSITTDSIFEKRSVQALPKVPVTFKQHHHSKQDHRTREVAKPIAVVMPRGGNESDDSASNYSVNGATVYNENMSSDNEIPPPPPPKGSVYYRYPPPKLRANQTSSDITPTHQRRPSLRDMIKPIDQLGLPPEVQKDLLPLNPVSSDKRFVAARSRQQEECRMKSDRERLFRGREALLPYPTPLPGSNAVRHAPPSLNPSSQTVPPHAERIKEGRVFIGGPTSAPRDKSSRRGPVPRDSKPQHAPLTSGARPRNLKLGADARHGDRRPVELGLYKQGLPASPRPEDARKVRVAPKATGYPASGRVPNSFRESQDSKPTSGGSYPSIHIPSYHYCHGHFRMHSDRREYERLPPPLQRQPNISRSRA